MDHDERDNHPAGPADDIFEQTPAEPDAYDPPAAHAAETPPPLTNQLESQLHTGANWFYWIAALSIVNSVIIASGAEWGFVVGLGVTQVIDGVAAIIANDVGGGAATVLTVVALTISVGVAGMVALMGYLANRRHTWAFVLGMVCYGFDALIFLLVGEWGGVIFHGFALFGLFAGYSAARQLNQLPPEPEWELVAEAG